MTVTVLTVNSGSTSVKLRLIGPGGALVAHRSLDELPRSERQFEAALEELAAAHTVDVVAHRVVHGGRRLLPSVVDDDLLAELGESGGAAPLHAAPALLAIAIAQRALDAPHIACFDTTFHQTLPPEAATYAVPQRWREHYGLRRYGFHGLSHAYAARRVVQLVPRSARLVTCHLGGGASLALYGVGALIASAILALALVMPGWLAALIVAVVLFVIAGVLALVGKKQVSQAVPPMPKAASDSVRADIGAVTAAVKDRGRV